MSPRPSAIRKIMACCEFLATITLELSAQDIQAPAKINLFLAITGRRPDGYHDLLSVAAPLVWGDSLEVQTGGEGITLATDNAEVPTDSSNLVVRAAEAFRPATGWEGGGRFTLKKKIPIGCGPRGARAATPLRPWSP